MLRRAKGIDPRTVPRTTPSTARSTGRRRTAIPRNPTRKLYRVAFAPNQKGNNRDGQPCRSRSVMRSMPKGSTFRVVPPYSAGPLSGGRSVSVSGLLRIPGLKKSSRSLRRHDPDQVPRVSPSCGRLSALLGSPFEAKRGLVDKAGLGWTVRARGFQTNAYGLSRPVPVAGQDMKGSGKCPKCGGDVTRSLPAAPDNLAIWSRGGSLPDAWVMAYVCRQCGFVEFYAEGSGWIPPSP